MKNLKIFSLFLASMLLFTACSKDDENPEPTATFTFGAETVTLTSGEVIDYGTVGFDDDPTHWNYDFEMTGSTASGRDVELYAELFSSGTTSFNTGTFTFIDDDNINSAADIAGKNFFVSAEIWIDTNGDEVGDENEYFDVTGGTTTVSGGTNNNYTIEYDVTFDNGTSVAAKYTGTFTYFDETDGFAPNTSTRKKRFADR
jgi:hypothetical protein